MGGLTLYIDTYTGGQLEWEINISGGPLFEKEMSVYL